MFGIFKGKAQPAAQPAAKRVVVKVGAQFVEPTFALTQNDVDEVLKRANLTRSDLLRLTYDDEIHGCIERRVSSVTGNAWTLEGDNTDWLYIAIDAIHEIAVRVMMPGKWVGSSIGEIVYQAGDDGIIRIEAIVPRAIEQFKLCDKGLRWKNPMGGEVAVIPEKVLRMGVNVHAGNPFGDALLSRVYWPWFNKNYGEQFWSKFTERHASPLTVVKSTINTIHREEAARDLAELAAAVAGAVGDGTVAMSDQDTIEFVESNNDGEAHAKFVRHQIQRIQKTLIGRVLTPDLNTGSGSRAAQETDDVFYQDITDADLSYCERGMNHLVRCLLTVNGQNPDGIYFAYTRKDIIDKTRWERDVALLNAGALTFTPQYFRDHYGLEEAHFSAREALGNMQASLSAQPLTAGAQEVEDGITQALAIMPEILSEDSILALAQEAESDADLICRLALLYDDHDAGQYEQWLAAALALAEAQGFTHAKQGRF